MFFSCYYYCCFNDLKALKDLKDPKVPKVLKDLKDLKDLKVPYSPYSLFRPQKYKKFTITHMPSCFFSGKKINAHSVGALDEGFLNP